MFTRRNVSCDVHSLLSILILGGFITSCAPTLVGPIEPNSSLIIGRVVINNQYRGQYGALPLGTVEKGIEVEVESLDRSQQFSVTTEDEGYFFLPNIPPSTYQIVSVRIEGTTTGRGDRERYGIMMRRFTFTPIPGKIAYIGSLIIDLPEDRRLKLRETREDDRAKTHFYQRYAASPWAARELTGIGPRPAPGVQVAKEKASQVSEAKPIAGPGTKAEKPDWKVGYLWRYAWKRPRRSGTLTREIIREDVFEGVPSYVVRVGKIESFYAKDTLGIVAGKSGGKLTVKRTPPPQILSFPLEIGKEWKNSFLVENIAEKSSQTFDFRVRVSNIENVEVPAGTFEALKIEVYGSYTGNLVQELWYSPRVKSFIRQRSYLQDGLREEELISYKVD